MRVTKNYRPAGGSAGRQRADGVRVDWTRIYAFHFTPDANKSQTAIEGYFDEPLSIAIDRAVEGLENASNACEKLYWRIRLARLEKQIPIRKPHHAWWARIFGGAA